MSGLFDNFDLKNVQALYLAVRSLFRDADLVEADLDARVLVAEALEIEPRNLILEYDQVIKPETLAVVSRYVEERLAGKPVGRVLGKREFWGLEFSLSSATLEPRPDTETLVETAIAFCQAHGGLEKEWVFADIGTGTGAVAIALLTELPNAICLAVDISEEALETARQNAANNKVLDRFIPVRGSYLDALSGSYDFVVSNPPYIRSSVIEGLSHEVKQHDPMLALDGGVDGLTAYKELIGNAKRVLKRNSGLLMEIGFDQADELSTLARELVGLEACCEHDLAGQPRVIVVVFP
ncbi:MULTISPECIES: peptide chain release factor N(5)-glutamine methyltransferase [unclassified Pseudovibrio]|uniref:peptide chain release factor N(5)-glutamine methyltransferase n=1 Tax=unclassified Pseudovibrio TaxID=2627060 RepID=UPI0007AEDB8A|nr:MULTISPECIES: peptide chain release factor N(5)-glutamine methyltransferase [unclassified Pseudovibrio]KZL01704.1 Release factor glutamine methyltransferase [Pseudovibrio sp. W74]KZL11844.1 Release factor glutamine methyltransferase [Pseudovibrio sp. Ad14]